MTERIEALRAADAETPRPYVAVFPQGAVQIGRLTFGDDHVDVWISSVGDPDRDPDYRIYNPPLMVEDPSEPSGLRADPMLALAQALALAGGALYR